MRTQLIGLCLLSVLGYIAWLGYCYMRAIGAAFGNVNPALGPSHVNVVLVAVAVATVVCVAAAMFAPPNMAKVLALFPLLLIGLGQGYFVYSERSNYDAFTQQEAVGVQTRRAELELVSKDFVLMASDRRASSPFAFSFLTRDESSSELIRVDVSHSYHATRLLLGRVNGSRLEIPRDRSAFSERFYRNYVNEAGESIFDHFEIVFVPVQAAADP